jgi:hypothetical protein
MNSFSSAISIIDEFTWRMVPIPLKDIIERRSWLLLLSVYTCLIILVIYRFVIAKNRIFFHGVASTSRELHDLDSTQQIKELFIHLIFFLIPMLVAFAFNGQNNSR